MTDAYVNQSFETFEFYDIALHSSRPGIQVYEFVYDGVRLIAPTVPDPSPEELIDAMLTMAKAYREARDDDPVA
jgi:hypothetical protein